MYSFGPTPVPEHGLLYWFFDYILKVLEAGAGWPVAVLIIAYWFKKEIAKKIGDIAELWFPGGKAKMNPQGDAQSKKSEEVLGMEQAMEIERTQMREELRKIKDEKINTAAARDTFLKMAGELLAKNVKIEKELGYEKIYNSIWGSQLRILRWLATNPVGITVTDLQAHYAEAAKVNDFYLTYPIDNYIGFLKNIGFVEFSPAQRYVITKPGKEFVDYIVENNYPDRLPW